MSIRPFRDINRKKTKIVKVGNVIIGGNNPISVQSMTNTLTTDKKSTIKQINNLDEEGADLDRHVRPRDRSEVIGLQHRIRRPGGHGGGAPRGGAAAAARREPPHP